jgi:hypothetical protein
MIMHHRVFALGALFLALLMVLPVPASAVVVRGKVSLLGGHITIRGGHIYIGANTSTRGVISIGAQNNTDAANPSTTSSADLVLGLGTLPTGSLVVVAANTRTTSPGSGTVTLADSGGNTWTQVSQQKNSTNTSVTTMFYSVLTTGLVNTSTVTLTGTNFTSGSRTTAEFYVLTNGTALDASNGAINSSTANPTVTSSTVTAGLTEVVIGLYGTGNSGTTATPPVGFSEDYEYSGVGGISTTVGSETVSNSSGTYTYSPTLSASVNGTSIIAVFK